MMNLKILMRWMTLEKQKWPKFTQEVEILNMSMHEEEAKNNISKDYFQECLQSPKIYQGVPSWKGRDNYNVIYTLSGFFLKVLLKLNFLFLISITLDSKT